jgi:hypothetical protein
MKLCLKKNRKKKKKEKKKKRRNRKGGREKGMTLKEILSKNREITESFGN